MAHGIARFIEHLAKRQGYQLQVRKQTLAHLGCQGRQQMVLLRLMRFVHDRALWVQNTAQGLQHTPNGRALRTLAHRVRYTAV
ncbi:hypothetical protein FQZ97_1214860 [compost metagenome]